MREHRSRRCASMGRFEFCVKKKRRGLGWRCGFEELRHSSVKEYSYVLLHTPVGALKCIKNVTYELADCKSLNV